MSKKITLFFVGVFLFFGVRVAHADILINEIMYTPASGSAHEWLEIYNSGNDQVDLTNWRFFNNENDSSPLSLKKGTAILASGGYAIITKTLDGFMADWSSFSGTVFTSSTFSLPDNSLTYNTYKGVFSDTNKTIGSFVTYDTNLGGTNGTSLSKINNLWTSGVPTPGLVNQDNLNSTPVVGSVGLVITPNNSSTTQTIITETKPKVVEIPKIKTKIIASTLAYVGIPFDLDASTTGYSNEIRNYGKYYWNFGDGDSKEINLSQITKFSHIYYYSGEYEITLEYYPNFYSDNPETTNKLIVKVIPASVVISKVGDEKDFFVELSNNTDYDINVSKWMLVSNNRTFILPKNTNIFTKAKITLSSRITNFTMDDKDSLKLLTPTSEIVFEFNSIKINESLKNKIPNKSNLDIEDNISTEYAPSAPINNIESNKDIQGQGLSASAILSDANNNSNRSYFFFWGFVVLLIVASGGVYYIRQKKNIKEVGDDFKIIDE